MDTASARRFRATRIDDRGGPAHARIVDGPGFPCRHCLKLGETGEEMLLVSWDLPLPQGPCTDPLARLPPRARLRARRGRGHAAVLN